ncbi:MAG TPA: hypothetical protein DFS52_30095, partial [Myxococcales bacterium]|nr:hypothetical protein [Myxococcales bacterium]
TDASGRLSREVQGARAREYGWDAAGRLVSVTDVESGSAGTTTYGYDWANLRRSKVTADGVSSSYLWAA